ncbi:MAG: sugar ABC transporter permease [Treponema sp.]|nr:sugar ABC transporter permease [Treponema sp.]
MEKKDRSIKKTKNVEKEVKTVLKKKSNVSYAKYGYIFSIPFMVAFLIFSLYPTLYTAILGFTNLRGAGNTNFKFLAFNKLFENYKSILENPTFRISLANTLKLWICNFIPQMILALLLAAWFTNRRVSVPGEGAFKVLFYMPNIITAATVAILFNALFADPIGPINNILQKIGVLGIDPATGEKEVIKFLQSKSWSQGIVMFIQTWMWYGYTMIIMISAILGISPDIFEAADIDGASGIQVFFKITIPNIKTILLFTLVTSLIGGLNMFDIPQLFNNGGPDRSTMTTNVFIYRQAFSGGYLYNKASAASMLMWLLIVACSAVMFFAMRDKEEVALAKQKKLEKKEAKLALKEAKLAAKKGVESNGK